MKIALVQMSLKSDAPMENMARLKTTLNHIKDLKARMVVFPRLSLFGHLPPEVLARPGLNVQCKKVWEDFLKLSREYPEQFLASSQLSFKECHEYGCEEAFIVKNGQAVLKQIRIIGSHGYPPNDWPVLNLEGHRIRVVLEDDVLLPGAVEGADILINLKNRPFEGRPFLPRLDAPAAGYWRLQVSQVGGEGGTVYDGGTLVYDPQSRLKGWAYGFDGTVIDLDTSSKSLPDIKILPARPLDEALFEAIKVGIKDFAAHSGFGKAVIGLSGGVDSAVLAAVASQALGPENILGVAMPSEYNAPESLNLARALAKNLKIGFTVIPITAVKDSFLKAFMMHKKNGDNPVAEENIQARIRATMLMYLANLENRMILASSNKREAAVGYCTLYGDSCGALAPLGDVYKRQVYELAGYINRDLIVIPEEIIHRAPSAELKPGQKDEDSLPPYDILDDILARYLEGRASGSQIVKEGGHSPMTVAWALSAMKRSAFKRAQSPPVLKVSSQPLAER